MRRLVLVVATLLCLVAPAPVYAYDPFGNVCNTPGASDSSACSANDKDPITGTNGIIRKVSLFLAVLAGISAVILIIIGGFRYVTAAGDTQKLNGARDTITGALIGLVIIAVSESLLIFIMNKLG